MKVRIHGKNLPKKFRHGVFGMTHLTMRDLLNNRRVVNNLEIDIHFLKGSQCHFASEYL